MAGLAARLTAPFHMNFSLERGVFALLSEMAAWPTTKCQQTSTLRKAKLQIGAALLGGTLVLGLFGHAVAGPLEDAKAAQHRADFGAELTLLRPLAESGAPEAQEMLGELYESGVAATQGIQQNYVQAADWYRRAADQGNTQAQFKLGTLYNFGFGVPQDYALAGFWDAKAAKQGDASAQFSLGDLYEWGHGVPQDYVQAASWYRRAAEQGDRFGQSQLGMAYYTGHGVPQDYAQAVGWFQKAAEQGEVTAQGVLVVMYGLGQGVPKDLGEVAKWRRKLADEAAAAIVQGQATSYKRNSP